MHKLDGLRMSRANDPDVNGPEDRCVQTYVASLDGVLRAAGWWDDELPLLAAVTGLPFEFTVHPGTCPSSPTAYDWPAVHANAARRLGLRSSVIDHWTTAGFDDAQAKAVDAIKKSL